MNGKIYNDILSEIQKPDEGKIYYRVREFEDGEMRE